MTTDWKLWKQHLQRCAQCTAGAPCGYGRLVLNGQSSDDAPWLTAPTHPEPRPDEEGRETDCCELAHRSMLLALVRCIVPAIKAGEVTDALRHQVKRLAATYDGEFSVTLAEAIVDRGGPPPNEPKLIRSAIPKKYLVWPGWVTSSADGDQHYIDAPTLMRLYGVRPDECVVARGYDLNPRHGAESCIDLMPRRDGNYTIPEKRA